MISNDMFTKTDNKVKKYKNCISILKKKQRIEGLIKYFKTSSKPCMKDLNNQFENKKMLYNLDLKNDKLKAMFPEDKFAHENDIVDTLLLEPLSDSDIESFDKNKESNSISEKDSVGQVKVQNLIDIGNESLMDMVRQLHKDEAHLDYIEHIKEQQRKKRDEKAKELVEADNAEESKLKNEAKLQDWADEVENDLSDNFRQKCMVRLKENDDLNWISYSERFPNLKTIKNMLTIKKPSKAWIRAYALQENERYKHPTKPWLYYNPDNTTSIVAPVLRKVGQATNKAREHNALK